MKRDGYGRPIRQTVVDPDAREALRPRLGLHLVGQSKSVDAFAAEHQPEPDSDFSPECA